MGGGLFVEELPYFYGHRGYPVREHWVPVYDSSFPAHYSNGLGYYYDDSPYDAHGDSVPMIFMEVPCRRDADLVRKRKLDGLKRESMSAGERNVRDGLVEKNADKAPVPPPVSKPMPSQKVRSSAVSYKVDAPVPNHSTVPSVEKVTSLPDAVSIPVIFTDGRKDSTEKLVPKEGAENSSRSGLSAGGAATVIQSWFRGHLVRTTEPLAHLRTIASVRLQLMELEEKTSDVDYIDYIRENSSGRIKLTESIMNLLLQLDAIQGIHPLVREIRKATAKKVITLQERVDDLLSGKKAISQLPTEIEQHLRVSEAERGNPTETHPDQPSAVEDEFLRNSHHEVGEIQGLNQVDEGVGLQRSETIPQSVEENTPVTGAMSMDTTAARDMDLNEAHICQPEAVLEQADMCRLDTEEFNDDSNGAAQEMSDEEINQEAMDIICDTRGTEREREVVHTNDSSLQQSPRCPSEDCRDAPSSTPEIDHHFKGENFRERNLEADAQGKQEVDNEVFQLLKLSEENQALKSMLKLGEENQALKSILIGVMKWNQLQETAMKDVNDRLEGIEKRLSTRPSKKKAKYGHRRVGKSGRMYL